MSTSQRSYAYDQLPKDDTFRYLVLQPGAGYEPLVCNLHTAQIADNEYHAISYVWGTEIRDQTIICNGHVMMVTINLFKALHCIRLPDRPLALWADSICINQEDTNEKSHQVSLMGKVYRAAKCVLIFIGSDDNGHGPHVCSLLDEVDEMIQSTCKKIDMTLDSFPFPNEDDPLLNDPRWDSLKELMCQGWFGRGWVVQEAALAAQGEVLWGKSRFDWQKLMRTYLWLVTRTSTTCYAKGSLGVPIVAHRNAYSKSHEDFARAFHPDISWLTQSILKTLEDAKALILGDPRDRIYAFAELPHDEAHRISIDPDYSPHNTYLEVYRQFAVIYIQSTKRIDLLDHVCHGNNSFNDGPSWVPHWDVEAYSLAQKTGTLIAMQPRVPHTFNPPVIDAGKLKVRGVIIDTLHYVSDVFDWETTTAETIRRIWNYINAVLIKNPYGVSETAESHLLDAILEALTACSYEGEWFQWRQARKSFASKARLKQARIDDDQPLGSAGTGTYDHNDTNIFFSRIRDMTHNCSMVLTKRGYIGLAPSIVREGDTCGIIFGCNTPCILRKAAQDQHYAFVGATTLVSKESFVAKGGGVFFRILGREASKDWVDWDVEEQDIYLC
jgi:hypothetical protein